ncbi:MAG: CoB--CoM heterodisulfide reductase iron-sulfur subunit B family protein [Thermodesulfobacteriota bacterium]|jgi:heterodisulfide reductase subunit B|nr:MAG: CoB--CoM heterodisulfide reductase iron-sulfur subunit B family protein [Thermodesulfobacteriota bacterium]
MKYAYYPGCASDSTAREQHASCSAVARALGIDLTEIEGWTCCGTTPAHQTDRVLSASLPAANLARAQKMGLDVVVTCAACYSMLKMANYEVLRHPKIREHVGEALGHDYDGSVRVRHFVEVLLEDVEIDRIKKALKRSLNGLKVACYYGCLLVRPPEVNRFDNPENPVSLDRLVTAIGGESLDWPHKVECCGGALSLTRSDVVVKLSDAVLTMARAAGAECVAVACPMCQINLDLRQSDIKKETGRDHNLPIIYITQLLGLCLGISADKLGLEKLMVSPERIVQRLT